MDDEFVSQLEAAGREALERGHRLGRTLYLSSHARRRPWWQSPTLYLVTFFSILMLLCAGGELVLYQWADQDCRDHGGHTEVSISHIRCVGETR